MNDLSHTTGGVTTVLRGFNNGSYFVVQGFSFNAGLKDNYREFSDYGSAVDYFSSVKNEVA